MNRIKNRTFCKRLLPDYQPGWGFEGLGLGSDWFGVGFGLGLGWVWVGNKRTKGVGHLSR